jgi:large subunit ribosomal protein L29
MKKRSKFNEMSPVELRAQERDMTEQLFRLRFQAATGQGEGLRKLRVLKKDLARVKTALRAGELKAGAAK